MSARLTSSLFISAIIRRANLSGGFAAVLRHGSDEAGAIFICVPERNTGCSALYAQVPQSVLAEAEDQPAGGRMFERIAEGMSDEDLAGRFDREARLDPDFWVLEIEVADGVFETLVDLV